jgi:hypothetical protein
MPLAVTDPWHVAQAASTSPPAEKMCGSWHEAHARCFFWGAASARLFCSPWQAAHVTDSDRGSPWLAWQPRQPSFA